MISIKEKFGGVRLNIKFTLIIIAFVILPVAILASILFYIMEENVIDQQTTSMEYNMEKTHTQVLKNVESINMSMQFFLNDASLLKFLNGVKENKDFSTTEMLEFYNKDIASLERMVNNNPYLYQIHIYADNETMQEMMPILFRESRMKKLDWAEDEKIYGWKFGYTDNLFGQEGLSQQKKIMSLVNVVQDYKKGKIGIIEVAMNMDTMFPDLYKESEGAFSCFIDKAQNRYTGVNEPKESTAYLDKVLTEMEGEDQLTVYDMKMNGENMIVGYLPLKELGGNLVCIKNISQEIQEVYNLRLMFVVFMVLILIAVAFFINLVVRGVLRKFYDILHSIRKIQKGNLDVVIKDCKTDEMGELGTQINKMMQQIKKLMEDNLNRELLVKNSEIRALQNQINAHFIYNVLESIKMMAEIKEEYRISDAITSLGRLLRYSMKWVSGNVPVGEEIEYIKNYLALINLRFDYEITLSLNLPEQVMKQEIPKMSLQPIVENAIYHGIEQMAEDTTIYIKGMVVDEVCLIEITDAGKGMTEEEVEALYQKISGKIEISGGGRSGNGIGLKNVQDRIKITFGDQYGIEISSRLGCYTKVTVRIPDCEKSEADK